MGRRGVPDRWLSYSPIGERIPGTPFISFKVPLKEALIRSLPEKERFTTQVLMESVPNLGLVIDLTNTDRYYNRQDFLGQGIRYEKIFCRGHEIPSRSVVDKFFSAVDKYIESLKSPDAEDGKLIGVHCTHGLNRTGYLVCRYMIRRLGFTPEDAISAFEKARGYPMEREAYLNSLRQNEDSPGSSSNSVNNESHNTQSTKEGNEDSAVLDGVQPNGFPDRCQDTWTHNASELSRDIGAGSSSDFRHNNDFWRFTANRGRDVYRSDPRSMRDSFSPPSRDRDSFSPPSRDRDSFSPPSRNYRPKYRNDFADSPRSFRASGYPYGWKFDPEEHCSRNDGRFHEPDFFHRSRYTGPRGRSFSRFRGSRSDNNNWRDSN